MRLPELREMIKDADRDTLLELAAQLYKAVPTAVKETEVDPLVRDVLNGTFQKKRSKGTGRDFPTLKKDILTFLEDSYAGNYYMDNDRVPQYERGRWRFTVKQFVKELEAVSVEDENYPESAALMVKLYRMMCTACGTYMFSSEDPFRSVGIPQNAFYRKVLSRCFALDYSRERVEEMMDLAVEERTGINTLFEYLLKEFLSFLKTSDLKYTAMELAKEKVQEKKPQVRKVDWFHRNYRMAESSDYLCQMVLAISILLGEPEQEIPWYFESASNSSALSDALRIAETYGDDSVYCMIYEFGLSRGMQTFGMLEEQYKKRKKNLEGRDET